MRRLAIIFLVLLWAGQARASTMIRDTAEGNTNAGTGTTATCNLSNYEVGDLMIFVVGKLNNDAITGPATPASGWTTRVTFASNDVSAIYTRTATGSEPASYSATWTNSAHWNCAVIAVKSTDGSTVALDAVASTFSNSAGSLAAAAATATQNDDLLVWITVGPWGINDNKSALPAAVSLLGSPTFIGVNVAFAGEEGSGASITPTFTMAGTDVTNLATLAIKSNTTTAANIVGVGAENFNSGSTSGVSPVTPTNAVTNDILIAGISQKGSGAGAQVGPGVGGDVFTSTGSASWETAAFAVDCAGSACTPVSSSGTGSAVLTLAANQVSVGDEMIEYVCSGGANTAPAGWTALCSNSSSFPCGMWKRTANSTDHAGTTYTWTTGGSPGNLFSDWSGSGTPTIAFNTCSSGASATSVTTPQVGGCAAANCTLVNIGWQGSLTNTVTKPASNTSLTSAIINAKHSYRVLSSLLGGWTRIGSQIVDPSTATALDLFWHQYNSGTDPATVNFYFGANVGTSAGLITAWSNLNTTTPVDVNSSLALTGLGNPVFPLLTPTTADELIFRWSTLGATNGSGLAIPYPVTNIFTGPLSGFSAGYGGVSTALSQIANTTGVTNPFATASLGLKAATTPTRPSANGRINQAALIVTSTVAPPATSGVGTFQLEF